MKTLIESLFDKDIVEKDLLDNPEFEEWINRPDVLWYIYYYWSDGMEDPLEDFYKNVWDTYKPYVDFVLNKIDSASKKVIGSKGWPWWMINYDQYDLNDDVRYKFDKENDFYDELSNAINEIKRKSTQIYDGVWKTRFKGNLPKNSDVTYFLNEFNIPICQPGKLDGGLFLTNEDDILILIFPKGIDKNILKLFNIR